MRLRSLAVRNFRGIDERRVDLAENGVTVLEGPNEVGKTSLAEALEMLFERRDSSVAEDVRDAQPLGRDVGPEVEVEATCGNFRFRYRKRFLKQPLTELEVTEPSAESWTGREAHDRVDEILAAAGVDRDLWRALRVVQGTGVTQPEDLTTSPSLMDALSGAGTVGEESGRRQVDLYAAIRAEHGRYFTEARRAATGELKAAREALAEAVEREDDLGRRMRALEADAERASVLEERRVELRGGVEEAERAEAGVRSELERVGNLEKEVAGLRSSLGERETLHDALREVSVARERAGRLARRRRSALAAAGEAEEILVPARQAFQEARRAVTGAESRLERRREELRILESWHGRRDSLVGVDERLKRAREQARRVASAEEALAALPKVSSEALDDVESAARLRDVQRARQESLSPRFRLTAARDLELDWSGVDGPSGLAAGEDWEGAPSGALSLHLALPGTAGDAEPVASLRLDPGSDAAESAETLRQAEAALERRLEALGVRDIEAARHAQRRRVQVESERTAARSALAGVTGDAGIDGLEARRMALTEEVEGLAVEWRALSTAESEGVDEAEPKSKPEAETDTEPGLPVGGAAPPMGLDPAREALAAARREVEVARRSLEEAREEGEARRKALDTANATAKELAVELRLAEQHGEEAANRAANLLRRHDQDAAAVRLLDTVRRHDAESPTEPTAGTIKEAVSHDAAGAVGERGRFGDEGDLGAEGRVAQDGQERRSWEAVDPRKGGPSLPGPGQLGLFLAGDKSAVRTTGGSSEAGTDGPGASATAEDATAEDGARLLPTLTRVAEEAMVAGREALAVARRRLESSEPSAVRRRAEEARRALTTAREEKRRVDNEHLQVRARLDHEGEQGLYQELEEARGRLAAARRTARTLEARAAAADRLREAVDRAREVARRAYTEPLARTVADLGRSLYGDDFTVELSDDLHIARRTAFGTTLDYGRLSSGAQEQLSLLLRLACAVLVSPQEGVPLVLDDALGYSDDERLQRIGEILSRAGERCQVLVLTCYPRRYRHIEGARRIELASGQADRSAP